MISYSRTYLSLCEGGKYVNKAVNILLAEWHLYIYIYIYIMKGKGSGIGYIHVAVLPISRINSEF